jgi:hypothetical protein
MEPMDIVAKSKEDASLPKGIFYLFFYENWIDVANLITDMKYNLFVFSNNDENY